MCSVNSIHVILLQKSVADVFSKYITCSSSWNGKARLVSVRIAPHQVCVRTFMRNFLNSLNRFDIVYLMQCWTQATMHTENFIVNNGSDRKIIKNISEHLPHLWISIFALAFSIKAINLRNLSCFMVASQKTDSRWVPKFQSEKKGDSFYWVCATIDIVS